MIELLGPRRSDVVRGFGTPFGLKLLSTVHWIAHQGGAKSLDAVVAETYAWGERKRRFTPEQIALALDVLTIKGWLPAN